MVDLLVKKKSSIHGIGIFATKNINKGTVFYDVPVDCVFNEPKTGCAFILKNRWVFDEKVLNYINHSCNPNSILAVLDKPKLVAKRDIKSDEEITVDYNKTEHRGKKVPCNCNSRNCKKIFLRIE